MAASVVCFLISCRNRWRKNQSLACHRAPPETTAPPPPVPPSATECHRAPPSATECHRVPPSATECHRVPPSATECHRVAERVPTPATAECVRRHRAPPTERVLCHRWAILPPIHRSVALSDPPSPPHLGETTDSVASGGKGEPPRSRHRPNALPGGFRWIATDATDATENHLIPLQDTHLSCHEQAAHVYSQAPRLASEGGKRLEGSSTGL